MNSPIVASLCDALLASDPYFDKDMALECSKCIADAGFTELGALISVDKVAVNKLKCSAAAKAALRRLCVRKSEMGNQQTKTVTKRARINENKVSAESVCKAINVAKAMKVQRPDRGPRAMCKLLQDKEQGYDRKQFYLEIARLEAICGNMVSIGETKSALNSWCNFAITMGIAKPGSELPPTPDGLLAWSRIFAVKGTFQNYKGKLCLACQIAGESQEAFAHPALKRAKQTIGSLEGAPRPKRCVSLEVLEQLISLCALDGDVLSQVLYLASYIFLLRVPSEGLPLTVGDPIDMFKPLKLGTQSVIIINGDKLVLRLAKLKNKPRGTSMTRECWCKP